MPALALSSSKSAPPEQFLFEIKIDLKETDRLCRGELIYHKFITRVHIFIKLDA
tara:strand:- start:71772 stop:71933 length:162 start_codon:yes stop_codon:yes gene_type:complete